MLKAGLPPGCRFPVAVERITAAKENPTMMKRPLLVFLLPVFLLPLALSVVESSAALAERAEEVIPDVRYEPTPAAVVAEMLRLADVRAADVVYDLGSGDGRIVITAARERGARGVGIDIDPRLIDESRRNAAEAGVTDWVEFRQEDLFTADFSEADVVTLYLLQDLNRRLRPQLFKQLKPGARVVSHDFDMGEWKADARSIIGRSTVFYWVMPANVSGRWAWSLASAPGEESYQLQLQQLFQQVSGALKSDSGFQLASWAALTGDRLALTFEEGIHGRSGPVFFEGRIRGEVIEGTLRSAGSKPLPWRAVREPGTMTDLE
jgi:SAM-dependent methyltransferase